MDMRGTWGGVVAFLLAAPACAADLTVTVAGLKPQGGLLNVSLFNTAAAWNDEGEMVAAKQVEVDEVTEVIVFAGLVPGRYAIRLMHDENGNGKLDSNFFGIPKEGWGFSNNPRTMGPAKWDQAAFDLADEGLAMTIEVR